MHITIGLRLAPTSPIIALSYVITGLVTALDLRGWVIESNYHYFHYSSLSFALIGLEPLLNTLEACFRVRNTFE